MSNVREFPNNRDRSSNEASEWIAKMANGLTSEQEAELGDWLNKSEYNRREFMELAKLWDSMDALSRLASIFPEPEIKPEKTSLGRSWSVAAGVVIAVGLAGWFSIIVPVDAPDLELVSGAAIETVLKTGVGQQSSHTLSDGTLVVLNTNSQVSINFTESNRLLNLQRGEMHLTVAHDPTRPLSVVIGDRVIQAIGTEFNLEISSDQSIELVVTDGLVMVGIMHAAVDDSAKPLVLDQNSAMVAAGQEVTIDADQKEVDSIEAEDIESESISVKLSWREGNLIFRGESLEEAVEEVGRYTAVEFVFLDEAAKKVRVAGLFKAGDVDGLLVALRTHFNISYEWQGDNKIVLSAE